MEWGVIESRWHEYKVAAKQRWDKLSEAQLTGTRGKRDFLLKRVQEAYGLQGDEAERQITDWQQRQFDRRSPAANT
jgi:uncharacterized protein YjbJ (UPF0337 family)